MPMGEIDGDRTDQYLPLSLVRARLARIWTLTTSRPDRRPGALRAGRGDRRTARLHHADDPQFLRKLQPRAAHLHGHLYMCLGQEDAADLRAPLRASESDEPLLQAIREAIARKPKGHDFSSTGGAAKPAVGPPYERDRRLRARRRTHDAFAADDSLRERWRGGGGRTIASIVRVLDPAGTLGPDDRLHPDHHHAGGDLRCGAAALFFVGDASAYYPVGVGACLLSTAIVAVVVALTSRYAGAVANRRRSWACCWR